MKNIKAKKEFLILYYIIALCVGLIVGVSHAIGSVIGLFEVLVGFVCIYYALQNNVDKVFSILPYLIYSEIYLRAFVRIIPYLFMPYLLIVVFVILLGQKGSNVKLHSRGFILMVLFTIIEIADLARSNDIETAKFYAISTLELTIVIAYASFNFFTPKTINTFFKHTKIASIYLAGIILVAHFSGQIDYSLSSNSDSTNGLAPVQISGYLSFSCILFFFSLMDNSERKHILINIAALSVCVILMLLSFSRGGLYFLAIIVGMYYIFNRGKQSSYLSFLILIPLSLFIYWYVTSVTNGAIEDRYAQQGTSGRDQLIQVGFELFDSNPFAGVGTGNFNTEITKQGLYDQESGAHNEFVRVAAEHGILGLVTYWGFYIIVFFEILGRRKNQREYALYFLVLFCLIIVHNGLKISLQPVLMALVVGTPSLTIKKRIKTDESFKKQLAV